LHIAHCLLPIANCCVFFPKINTVQVVSLKEADCGLLAPLQPEGWGDIQVPYQYYMQHAFCFPLKAVDQNEIMGIGTAIIHHDVAWLGHIIVHPGHRKKGIGLLVTQTLIGLPAVQVCETIYLIATALGAPIYEKCGFETETEYLYFKDIKAGDWPISPFIQPYQPEFEAQLTAMDRQISTEDRGFHITNYFSDAFVYVKENIVEGYYLPTLGEGMTIAVREEAGLALLQYRLQTHDRLAFPKDNIAAASFMYGNGYQPFSSGKRMRSGKKRNVQLANIYGRIGGNLG
jgi:GNAT superfamily N-acetyltransferase